MLQQSCAVKLKKSFVDNKTSPDFPSGWHFIFRRTYFLKSTIYEGSNYSFINSLWFSCVIFWLLACNINSTNLFCERPEKKKREKMDWKQQIRVELSYVMKRTWNSHSCMCVCIMCCCAVCPGINVAGCNLGFIDAEILSRSYLYNLSAVPNPEL